MRRTNLELELFSPYIKPDIARELSQAPRLEEFHLPRLDRYAVTRPADFDWEAFLVLRRYGGY